MNKKLKWGLGIAAFLGMVGTCQSMGRKQGESSQIRNSERYESCLNEFSNCSQDSENEEICPDLNGREIEEEVETRTGLDLETIYDLTYLNGNKCEMVAGYLQKFPGLESNTIETLLYYDISLPFLEYAMHHGHDTVNKVLELKIDFEKHDVNMNVNEYLFQEIKEITPKKWTEIYHKVGGDLDHYLILSEKGYSNEEIIRLTELGVDCITKSCSPAFHKIEKFEEIGITQVDEIEKLIKKHGLGIASAIGLSYKADGGFAKKEDIEFIEQYIPENAVPILWDIRSARLPIEHLSKLENKVDPGEGPAINLILLNKWGKYSCCGITTKAKEYLMNHEISARLTLEYKRLGINNEKEMVLLKSRGIDSQRLEDLNSLGFIDEDKRDYRLGKLLIANDSYEKNHPTIKEVGLVEF